MKLRNLRMGSGAATNSMLLAFVQIITTMLGLIITKLLSVHFSLLEYGTYSQALLVTSTATSISILGLTNATNYFYNRTADEGKQRTYIATIFVLQYAVGLLCAIAIIAFRELIADYFDNSNLTVIIPIIAFTPLLTNLIAMYQTLFVSIGKAKAISIRNLIVSLVRLLSVILACFIFNKIVTVLIVILALDVGQVVYFAVCYRASKFPIRIRDTRVPLLKEILAFSLPMAIYVMTNSLSRDMDKYVISTFANTETLAIYTNAAKVLPFDFLTSSLITVLMPIIIRFINQGEYDETKKVFRLYLRIGYILTFVFVGGVVALSKDWMLFLYDEKYLAGLSVFVIYLFVDMIRFANVTTVLSGAGKTKTLMVVSVIALACNAVFNMIGYQIAGMVGPALVTLMITLLMTVTLLWLGAKEIKTRIFNLFDFKEMSLIVIEICVTGVAVNALSKFLEGLDFPFVVNLVGCYGLYLFVLLALNYKRVMECFRQLNCYK